VQRRLFRRGYNRELDNTLGFEDIKKQPGYKAGRKARDLIDPPRKK
jgi:hypothetical protein